MIRILHILTDANIGGAGRYLVNYLRHRDRDAYDVSVILPRGSALLPEIRALDVPVVEADGIADRSLSLPAISGLKRAIQNLVNGGAAEGIIRAVEYYNTRDRRYGGV